MTNMLLEIIQAVRGKKKKKKKNKQTKQISIRLDRAEISFQLCCAFFIGSHVLFTRPTSTLFSKKKL